MNLAELYNDPSFAGSFSGQEKFYNEVKKLFPSISIKQIQKFLMTEKSYYLHQPVKRPKFYRKVYTKDINYLWQTDLLFLDKFWRVNKGYRYCCFVIDTLSKKLWAYPLKRKTGLELTKTLTALFTSERPKKLQVGHVVLIFNRHLLSCEVKQFIKHRMFNQINIV